MTDFKGLSLAFVHLLAVIGGLGGSFFMVFILSPVAKKNLDQEKFQLLIGNLIRRFHPFVLGCYGVLILTGAWMLTRYKIDAGINYFDEYGTLLFAKLGLVFVAIMIACYQFFGLGTMIVAMIQGEIDKKDLPKKLKLLRLTSLINFCILLTVVFLGLALTRA